MPPALMDALPLLVSVLRDSMETNVSTTSTNARMQHVSMAEHVSTALINTHVPAKRDLPDSAVN